MDTKIEPSNMFATPENMADLQAYINKFSGAEYIVAMTVAGMTWNLAAKLVEETLNDVEVTA